jgi:glycerophosphoryl diester phosphodiesterase
VLWDRWELASARAPRLHLDALLAAAAEGPELMLDLKGHDRRIPCRVLDAIADAGTDARVTVCSQNWHLLEPLRDAAHVRVVHSVGSARALERLHARFAAQRLDGISIHRRLLDRESARRLRSRAGVLMSWPVESAAEARRLAGLGVQGMISRQFEAIAATLAPQRVTA